MTDFNAERESLPAPPVLESARGVLRAYQFDLARTRFERHSRPGFSGALVLKVHHDGQAYCLRQWPSEGLPIARLRGLHDFLGYLSASDISEVPVPIAAEDGETLPTIGGRLWQLEPWMPGTADFHSSPTAPRLRAAMRCLARFHRAAQCYQCPAAGRNWFACRAAAPSPACRERLASIGFWTARHCNDVLVRLSQEPIDEFRKASIEILQLYRIARPWIEAELRSLAHVMSPLHPCLRDVWHDHLLFSGDELTGLIDPAATRTENVAADLSRLLGSLLADDAARREDALQAYSQIRRLSDTERLLVSVLDRSSVLLSGLTWIQRRLNAQLADRDVPRVAERMRTILERLRRLSRSV